MAEETSHDALVEPHTRNCCCTEPRVTKREIEILLLLAAGSDTEKVASALCISPHTATHHLGNMLKRLGAANRTELVALAYATGVLLVDCWPPRWSGRYCLPVARA